VEGVTPPVENTKEVEAVTPAENEKMDTVVDEWGADILPEEIVRTFNIPVHY